MLIEKADDEFIVECRQDLHTYNKNYSPEMSHGQNLLFSPIVKKFEINRNCLFLWDDKKIFKYKLHQNFNEENM